MEGNAQVKSLRRALLSAEWPHVAVSPTAPGLPAARGHGDAEGGSAARGKVGAGHRRADTARGEPARLLAATPRAGRTASRKNDF